MLMKKDFLSKGRAISDADSVFRPVFSI